MTQTLFNAYWYRVQHLTPHLQAHCAVHRHQLRGSLWYVLENKTSGRHHRLNSAAFRFITLLDGSRTVAAAWEQLNVEFDEAAPSQNDIIVLLSQLYSADLLHLNEAFNLAELTDRQTQHQQQKIKQFLTNPITQKLPLWDPDQFLNRHLTKVAWLFSWQVAGIWLLLVTSALLLGVMHWPALQQQLVLQALAPYNLILLWVLYPIIKGLHELGHAFATKIAGGEVHEMGINFFLVMPIPYVNVSAASHFSHKYQRILVGAAGMLVEMFLAALGLFIWLNVESGLIKDMAFTLAMVGGVSSLLFNGNPLLRYDGYFILADALEIPNLAQRANRYLGYWVQRYLFGIKQAVSPVYAEGEAGWFVVYSLLSCCYRLWVLWLIVVLVIEQYFVAGLVLACWLVIAQIGMPLFELVYFVLMSPVRKAHSLRVLGISGLLLSLCIIVLFIIPFPSYTYALGVVWLPEQAQLKVENAGFVESLAPATNVPINTGSEILRITDPALTTRVAVLQAKLNELEANLLAERVNNLVKAQMLKAELAATQSELALAKRKLAATQMNSHQAGQLLIPDADDLPGQFLKQGALVGYILNNSKPIIHTAVTQADMGKLRNGTLNVHVRLATHLDQEFPAKIVRETPEATQKLFSEALASSAGGRFVVDPNHAGELLALEKFFQVDVEFSPPTPEVFIGTRAHVRFEHQRETLSQQWYRSFRQLLLRQFNA